MTDADRETLEYLSNSPHTSLVAGAVLDEAAASVALDKRSEQGTHTVQDGPGARAVDVTPDVPTEAQAQRQVIEALLLDGWLVLRLNGGGMHIDDRYVEFCRYFVPGRSEAKGLPDLVALRGGYCLAIEMKAADGQQSEAQMRFMDACEETENVYVVARGVEDIEPWLTRVRPQ